MADCGNDFFKDGPASVEVNGACSSDVELQPQVVENQQQQQQPQQQQQRPQQQPQPQLQGQQLKNAQSQARARALQAQQQKAPAQQTAGEEAKAAEEARKAAEADGPEEAPALTVDVQLADAKKVDAIDTRLARGSPARLPSSFGTVPATRQTPQHAHHGLYYGYHEGSKQSAWFKMEKGVLERIPGSIADMESELGITPAAPPKPAKPAKPSIPDILQFYKGVELLWSDTNKTGYQGVRHIKGKTEWTAEDKIRGKTVTLGKFPSPEEAALCFTEHKAKKAQTLESNVPTHDAVAPDRPKRERNVVERLGVSQEADPAKKPRAVAAASLPASGDEPAFAVGDEVILLKEGKYKDASGRVVGTKHSFFKVRIDSDGVEMQVLAKNLRPATSADTAAEESDGPHEADAAEKKGLYEEEDPTVIDRRLGTGAAAKGWRNFEAWRGGGKHGNWKYISPGGEVYKTIADVAAARASGADDGRPKRPAKKPPPVPAADERPAGPHEADAAEKKELYEEEDPTVIDRRLGTGAAAKGWRNVEAYHGAAASKHGNWKYISPRGEVYKTIADAVAARASGADDGGPKRPAKKPPPVPAADERPAKKPTVADAKKPTKKSPTVAAADMPATSTGHSTEEIDSVIEALAAGKKTIHSTEWARVPGAAGWRMRKVQRGGEPRSGTGGSDHYHQWQTPDGNTVRSILEALRWLDPGGASEARWRVRSAAAAKARSDAAAAAKAEAAAAQADHILEALQAAKKTARSREWVPVPAARGWRMKWAPRGGDEQSKQGDIYWQTPTGVQLRSFTEARRWLDSPDMPASSQGGASSGAKQPSKSQDEVIWAECSACGKWRELPAGSPPVEGEWTCVMSLDPLRNTCSAPEVEWDEAYSEEEEDDDDDDAGLVVDGVSLGADRRAEADDALREARNGVPAEIDIYWPDDYAFYTAKVLGYDESTGQHAVRYFIDDEEEELDLRGEKWYPTLPEAEAEELLARINTVYDVKRKQLSESSSAGAASSAEPGPAAAPGSSDDAGGAGSASSDVPLRRAAAAAAMASLGPDASVKPVARPKQSFQRCGTCEGCAQFQLGTKADCGQCKHCKAAGSSHQTCLTRWCHAHPKMQSEAKQRAFKELWAETYMSERDKWEHHRQERHEAERAAREERTAKRAQIRAARSAAKQERRQRRLEREAEERSGGGAEAKRQKVAAAPPKREPPPPKAVETVLESNGQPGHLERLLVKWRHRPKSAATWEPLRKLKDLPPEEQRALVDRGRVAFNRKAEPLLSLGGDAPDSSGVVAVAVPEAAAARCAEHLHAHWRDGKLPLRKGGGTVDCFGYATYGKTLSAHDAAQQATHTLLMTNTLLPFVRADLPGFAEIEDFLVTRLHETHGIVVELYFAHGLRQSPETVKSTGFDVHQDTEDFPFIEYTVVVKLTPDAPGEAHSKMRVVGARRSFEYAAPAGSAGAFRARVYHASVEPEPDTSEHLKIAFFFRESTKGERRAKRGLAAAADANGAAAVDGLELAHRRKDVALQLSNSNLEAHALAHNLK